MVWFRTSKERDRDREGCGVCSFFIQNQGVDFIERFTRLQALNLIEGTRFKVAKIQTHEKETAKTLTNQLVAWWMDLQWEIEQEQESRMLAACLAGWSAKVKAPTLYFLTFLSLAHVLLFKTNIFQNLADFLESNLMSGVEHSLDFNWVKHSKKQAPKVEQKDYFCVGSLRIYWFG